MDKLERYLDRVCRGIGGPRSLRQHVRQELREHLMDAVARHRAAGLPDDEAIDRALEEFGSSEEVRSELEATHGHRLMTVMIDKAMQWKEMTMRAKWLWMSWAYVGLAIVISLEALFIAFIAMFIAPKFQLLMRDGLLDPAMIAEPAVSWMLSLLHGVWTVGEKYTTLFVLLAAAAWALFEWRVRSENKPLMRLSALATAAVALMAVVVLTAGSLVVLFCLGMPDAYRMARPFALNQISQISASVGALEQAMVKKDWETMREHVDRASGAIKNLANAAPAVPALATKNEPPTPEQLRAHVAAASEAIVSAQRAIDQRNVAQLEAAMEKFRQSYEPVREAALRGEK